MSSQYAHFSSLTKAVCYLDPLNLSITQIHSICFWHNLAMPCLVYSQEIDNIGIINGMSGAPCFIVAINNLFESRRLGQKSPQKD